jgi:8-oxo-dGTP pyrophosphatase MutT (NUDIX family)
MTAIRSVCVIIQRGDRYAAIRSKKRGGIELPGGKLNPGETPLDAAKREIQEELGVVVEALQPLFTVPQTVRGISFLCTLFSGRISPNATLMASDEGDVLWATREQITEESEFRRINQCACLFLEEKAWPGLHEKWGLNPEEPGHYWLAYEDEWGALENPEVVLVYGPPSDRKCKRMWDPEAIPTNCISPKCRWKKIHKEI